MKYIISILSIATLLIATANSQLVITTTNITKVSCGHTSGCPGGYCWYANFLPTNGNWGFTPVAGQTVYSATDTNHPNTKVQSVGALGDINCNLHTVEVQAPPFSPYYRFTVYGTNKATEPTNGIYTLLLTNFTD